MRAILIPVLALLIGCASANEAALMSPRKMAPGGDLNAGLMEADQGERLAEATPAGAPEVRTDAVTKRLIIYTARLAVRVASAEASADRFVAAVEAAGGYLGSRNDQQLVARVPADRFHALVASLEDYGAITSRNITANDVTAAYADLQIRIENAERGRDRLLKLLENATDTKALLEIERELRRLTEEIERMKGQLRLMGDQIAYSTLTVQFLEDAPEPRPVSLRRESRFRWINQIGVEHALERF